MRGDLARILKLWGWEWKTHGKLWNAVTLRLCSWGLRCSLLMPAILMASVIATKRWYITVWSFGPFPLEKKEAFRSEVVAVRNRSAMQGRRSLAFTEGTPRCLTFRSSHMRQTPREPVSSSFVCMCDHFILWLIEEMFPVREPESGIWKCCC